MVYVLFDSGRIAALDCNGKNFFIRKDGELYVMNGGELKKVRATSVRYEDVVRVKNGD